MITPTMLGTIAASRPSGGALVDRASLNPIVYTPTAIGAQTYYFQYDLSKLNDGNTTDSGVIATDIPVGGSFDVLLTAVEPFYLNQLTVYTGQFNGPYNSPTRLRLYADQEKTNLLYETALTTNYGAQVKALSAVAALNTPSSTYTIAFDQSGGSSVSVLELQLFGILASAVVPPPPPFVGAYSSSQVTLLGSAGMTNIFTGSVDDANVNLGNLGFDFPFYEGLYRSNVFVGSNSYLTFGFGSNNYSGLSHTNPGRAVHIGSADRGYQNVYVQSSNNAYRVRHEGSTGTSGASVRLWEATFFPNGVMMVVRQMPDASGLWTITKGDGLAYTDFAPPAGTSFVITPNAAFTAYTVQAGSYGSA